MQRRIRQILVHSCIYYEFDTNIIPELDDKLVPACEAKLWCPEGKMTCNKYPTKDQLKEILNNHKK